MAGVLPYVTAPGNVTKSLNGIISAATPERVSQDFVKEILKIPSGSGNQMTSYLKKIGLANSDGTPTDHYKRFRNSATRGAAAFEVLKYGYAELFKRNEYAHELSDSKLKGLIIEVTGLSDDSSAVKYIASCFKNIKAFASFEHQEEPVSVITPDVIGDSQTPTQVSVQIPPSVGAQGLGINLGYTINLNLPATSDIAVFNAIFKSLKENLLTQTNE